MTPKSTRNNWCFPCKRGSLLIHCAYLVVLVSFNMAMKHEQFIDCFWYSTVLWEVVAFHCHLGCPKRAVDVFSGPWMIKRHQSTSINHREQRFMVLNHLPSLPQQNRWLACALIGVDGVSATCNAQPDPGGLRGSGVAAQPRNSKTPPKQVHNLPQKMVKRPETARSNHHQPSTDIPQWSTNHQPRGNNHQPTNNHQSTNRWLTIN